MLGESALRRAAPERVVMVRREKGGGVVCSSKRGLVRRGRRYRFAAIQVATFALEAMSVDAGPPRGSAYLGIPSPRPFAMPG
jgi:hypothetical protein